MDDHKVSQQRSLRQSQAVSVHPHKEKQRKRPSKPQASPLQRARADSLARYLRWRHVHDGKAGPVRVRLSDDFRSSIKILVGLNARELDAALEVLVAEGRGTLVPSTAGVYFELRKRVGHAD